VLFGADYYPEHWPEERWEVDAGLMQKAGFNIVRLAEFAWVKMEPEPGRFDFEWLTKALRVLHSHGIKAVIGTPTATPPAWLCTSKPAIMRVDEQRRQVTFGNRQQSCINQPEYREHSKIIVDALVKAVGNDEAVYGWQIDNEFGPLCYCELCQRKFQEWLKAKYHSLEALEAAWGTIFWSQTYTDWLQIPLPWATSGAPNPSLALDFRRFFADCYAEYQQMQIDIIRKHSPKPITHNFMGLWPEVLNYQQLADQLDFVSWDNYPFGNTDPATVAASHDTMRGYKKQNFWVMEQMSGPGGWGEMAPTPKPGRIREWTFQAVGRGADAISYFRWRVCRYGTEQYWHGILNHDGTTNRRYAEIKSIREELARIEPYLEGSTVKAELAFINDYDSRFAFQYQKSNHAFSYVGLLISLYRGLYDRNVAVDILSRDWDLSNYKLVVAPSHFVLTEERARILRNYVEAGGHLVMTYRSAVKDVTGLIFNEPLPGLLQEVFGAVVAEYHSPQPDEENAIGGIEGATHGIISEAKVWLDVMDLTTAEALARYEAGFAPGSVAITRNKFGAGTAYYIGTHPSQEFCSALMEQIAIQSGIRFSIDTPAGVEASVRTGSNGELLFLVNHNDYPCSVRLPYPYEGLVGGSVVDGLLELDDYGVAVLRRV
jgi:beta-galactosidase